MWTEPGLRRKLEPASAGVGTAIQVWARVMVEGLLRALFQHNEMSATSPDQFPHIQNCRPHGYQEYPLGFVGIVLPWLSFLVSGFTQGDYLKTYEVICTFDLCLSLSESG